MTTPSKKFSYEPGLDGLRAVALLSIFVVHANVGLAPGGFLAVSTFFTLSGFLITALLVKEREESGRIDLAGFWQRRALRLLPASLLAILFIAILTIYLGDFRQVDLIGGDVVSTLAYVANWRFIIQEISYAGEFGGQSPLLHFWSLAIEEQFYLLFPLVTAAVMVWASNWHRALAITLIVGVSLSLVIGIVVSLGETTPDRLYFRTDIRAAELLIGSVLGLWWMGCDRVLSEGTRQKIRVGGAFALIAMVALIATSDYRDLFWYRGGLIAYSLLTCGVILAALESQGLVRKILSWPPLVSVGVVSYGAYLVHWPMFMWLYTETTISGPVRLLGGTAAAIAIATCSYRLVERPIRQKQFLAVRPLVGTGVGVALLAIVVAFAAPKLAEPGPMTLDQAAVELDRQLASTTIASGDTPTIGVFGDSTALLLALALSQYDNNNSTIHLGAGYADLGCSPSAPAQYIMPKKTASSRKVCSEWREKWRAASDTGELDAAVIQFGPWEVRATKLEGSEEFAVIGESESHDAAVTGFIEEGFDALVETPLIIILTSPYIEPGRLNGRSPAVTDAAADPARMDRLNEIIIEVANRYPNVAIVDLAGWVKNASDDNRMRPDGVHFSKDVGSELAPRFAETFATIVDVSKGGEIPEDTSRLFPVIRYIEP